jgi:methylglutaconyl-CoA hydratase
VVTVERAGPAAVVALDRPERRNAFDPALAAALVEALQECGRDEAVRVVVLTGRGTAFSAGMDVDALLAVRSQPAEAQLEDACRLRDLLLAVYRLPKPVVAAVNGPAFGAGAGLAVAADVALAAPEAQFAFSEARLGFVPALVSPFLVRALGERTARDLLLTARRVGAEEACRLGLVREVAASRQALPSLALDWAERFVASAPSSLAVTKALLAVGIDEALATSTLANAFMRGSAAMNEGLDAFTARRQPRWAVPDQGEGTAHRTGPAGGGG